MRIRAVITVLTIASGAVALVAVPAAGPAAAGSGTAASAVNVRIAERGAVLNDGSARVRVRVRCPAQAEVLEALVTVSQESGPSAQGGLPGVRCDGKAAWYRARVDPTDGAFTPGRAQVSAYVLVLMPDGSAPSGQDTRVVRLKGDRSAG